MSLTEVDRAIALSKRPGTTIGDEEKARLTLQKCHILRNCGLSATKAYEEVIRLAPEIPSIYFNFASALIKEGNDEDRDYEMAILAFGLAIKKGKNGERPVNSAALSDYHQRKASAEISMGKRIQRRYSPPAGTPSNAKPTPEQLEGFRLADSRYRDAEADLRMAQQYAAESAEATEKPWPEAKVLDWTSLAIQAHFGLGDTASIAEDYLQAISHFEVARALLLGPSVRKEGEDAWKKQMSEIQIRLDSDSPKLLEQLLSP